MNNIKLTPSIPDNITVDEVSANRSRISAYPFEAGYGITLAHPLRRLILTSSLGYAPISVKIEGASHEFDSIPGMHEDITIFILNLKKIRFILNKDVDREQIDYSFSGPMNITAKDLVSKNIKIANPKAILATLNEEAKLNFSIIVARGLGYVRSENITTEAQEGAIVLDAFFTPVKKITYDIQSILVNDSLDSEKIIFDIETDGQVSPLNVFINGLEIMYKQLTVFNGIMSVEVNANSIKKHINDSKLDSYLKSIETLELSARSYNSLRKSDILYIGDLILMNKNNIKNIKHLGKKSFDEIIACLDDLGYGKDFKLSDNMVNNLTNRLNKIKNINVDTGAVKYET